MAVDLTVSLEDRPGALAGLGEALGGAGINIDGACGFGVGGARREIHLLMEDGDAARAALERAGVQVGEQRDVLVVDAEDRPGALGEIARKIADAGANIEVFYIAAGTRVVVGADDLDKARGAL